MSNKYVEELSIPADLSISSLEYAILKLRKMSEDTNKITLICHKESFNEAYKVAYTVGKQLNCKINIIVNDYLDIDAWFVIDSIGYHLVFSTGA